jgi:hypothetical protein
VLGITDHTIIHSLYFFDPNGLRVELTTWAVDQEYMDREAAVARSRLDAWTQRKRPTQARHRGCDRNRCGERVTQCLAQRRRAMPTRE